MAVLQSWRCELWLAYDVCRVGGLRCIVRLAGKARTGDVVHPGFLNVRQLSQAGSMVNHGFVQRANIQAALDAMRNKR